MTPHLSLSVIQILGGLQIKSLFKLTILFKNHRIKIHSLKPFHSNSVKVLAINFRTFFKVGVDFATKTLMREDETLLRLQIWDISGLTWFFKLTLMELIKTVKTRNTKSVIMYVIYKGGLPGEGTPMN